MQIVQVAEALVASVMLSSTRNTDPAGGDIILKCYEKCVHNLALLPYPEEIIEEAKYIITVFTDEKMMMACSSWKLLQMKFYNSNRGGEEFFARLEKRLEDNSGEKEGSLPLLELYNFLIALGFRGCLWRDPSGKIAQLRNRLNRILKIDPRIQLCPVSKDFSRNMSMRHFDTRTVLSMAVMVLVFVFLILCLNDFLSLHSDIWNDLSRTLESSDHSGK